MRGRARRAALCSLTGDRRRGGQRRAVAHGRIRRSIWKTFFKG
ncbi:hypothetical protein C7S13_3975 [Burkholderia cepacia]|nr:hypothetical protein [Burkholderia cepacia]